MLVLVCMCVSAFSSWFRLCLVCDCFRPQYGGAHPAAGRNTRELRVSKLLHEGLYPGSNTRWSRPKLYERIVFPTHCDTPVQTMFVRVLPPACSARLWDLFMLDGCAALVRDEPRALLASCSPPHFFFAFEIICLNALPKLVIVHIINTSSFFP